MPEKKTVQRAKRAKREGKAPTTQAGEIVREEVEKIRKGEHGARSTKQAIAIGLSKARRAGIKLAPPEKGEATERTIKSAKRALKKGQKKPSPTRSEAITRALKREGTEAASKEALARQAKEQAGKRTAKERSEIAKKAAKTRLAHQTPAERRAIARKAARTRAARAS